MNGEENLKLRIKCKFKGLRSQKRIRRKAFSPQSWQNKGNNSKDKKDARNKPEEKRDKLSR
ncbi:MAG: hypothetical protein CMP11_06235 [Zetaproteobacteria bacterium]|nr:hypothetical protein [Pseudobdellovibrionaceae bacterium]